MAPRILGAAAIVGLTVLVCVNLLEKIAQPFVMRGQEQAQLNAAHQQRVATEADNNRLAAQYQYLKSPGGVEWTARKQGYVKHGEVSVVIENMPAAPIAAPKPATWEDRISGAWSKLTGR